MYEHIGDTTQLKNQTLAWQDKTLPHGTTSLAKQGVLKLQQLLDVLLPAVRTTTDKQFSGMQHKMVVLDTEGHVVLPGGPELIETETFNLYFYYFRGEVQGDLLTVGPAGASFFGSTEPDQLGKEMEERKEEEYIEATKGLRAMGEEHKKALNDLDILIKEESG